MTARSPESVYESRIREGMSPDRAQQLLALDHKWHSAMMRRYVWTAEDQKHYERLVSGTSQETPIKLRCNRQGEYCVSTVSVGALRPFQSKVRADQTEAERLATIITLERVLAFAKEKGAAFLPPPVEASIKMAHQLVKLRYQQMLDPSNFKLKEETERILDAALKSPVRSHRAIAAGIKAFLEPVLPQLRDRGERGRGLDVD